MILAAGAILRFWNFVDIPFAHDEFSALFRTDFSNFSDLINYGVKPDGHPAGIQVFLYYWISVFGATEWVVKLPFALMGVASIWVMYKIGKLWYNETVGLVSAAFIASLQYSILYSVTARPYISGMFFSLMLVWYWSKLIKNPTVRFWQNGLFFVLFSALCAYNHHFSLLFAALVWVSGLFFLPKTYWLKYALLGLAIFIVYIPHLSIFFHQLGNKGVEGWLAKPESDWLWTYIRYIFHYSWVVLGVAVALVIAGFFLKPKSDFSFKKFGLFALWFILPFAIGYYYSVHVSAVLQYSVLIFTFPFLFLALFGHLPQRKSGVNAILVVVILAVSSFTLFQDRLHFRLLYSSHYERIVVDTRIADQQDSTLKLIDSHRKITAYYSAKNEVNLENVVWLDSLGTEREFRAFIQEQAEKYKHLYLGAWASINPNYVHIIKEYFPYVLFQNDYVGGSTSLFTKEYKPAFSARVSRLDLTQEATP
ncbi:MAG: putative membrane protein, partial [Pseudoalteromonas distincta]